MTDTYMYNQKDFNLIASASFSVFLEKAFNETHSSEILSRGNYIDLICSELGKMYNNEYNKLILDIAPRSLKSFICTVAWPAFLLGKDPTLEIMCIYSSEELANNLSLQCKTILSLDWYHNIFPDTNLSSDKTAATDFTTTKLGGRFATTIFGQVVGRGADWIIVDDPMQTKDAFSDTLREKTNRNFAESISTRLNNKKTGKILCVMPRLHINDLSGFLLEKDIGFKYLNLPAIALKDETFEIQDPLTGFSRLYIRKKGELLNPERENLDTISDIKKTMGDFAFEAQYQQNPLPKGNGWLSQNKISFYSTLPILKGVILSWDTAVKTNDNNAYSACVVLGIDKDGKIYLLNVFRDHLEFVDLLNMIKEIYTQYKTYGEPIVLIEDASSGSSALQSLKSEIRKGELTMKHLIPIRAMGSKEKRFNSVLVAVENKNLLFPQNNTSWYADFEDELLSFPYSPYKDQCDALSQAINYLETNPQIPQQVNFPLASNGRHVVGGNNSCPSFLLDASSIGNLASRGGYDPYQNNNSIGTIMCRGTYRPKPY
ncbi:MAG: phage terminase large subunit [Alphaproteobacteria bacterium]|nr:phage terminase large subunit [Alphaproteobacteria bacterium]